eukprot:CCRYP_009751-RH/>CCRYP_009751-RH protein AED:0.49 eAED:1.00 QI:0/-1/0/1/-1/0/1/0/15
MILVLNLLALNMPKI